MIEGIFLLNRYGNLRFTKIYAEEENNLDRDALTKRIYTVIVDTKNINIILDFEFLGINRKLVFKTFGSTFLALILDDSENELAIMDFISVIMSCFDEIFKGVCEVDLIMNPEKIYFMMDEMISGGIVIETNKEEIIKNYNEKMKD